MLIYGKQMGRGLPMTKGPELAEETGRQITVYLTLDQIRRLKTLSWERRLPVSELVRRAINEVYGKEAIDGDK